MRPPRDLFVPELRDSDGDTLTVKTKVLSVWTGGHAHFGRFEAFICRGCGYTEFHASNPTAIPVDEIQGPKVLVPDDTNAPYR